MVWVANEVMPHGQKKKGSQQGLTVFFGIIHEFHYTISINIYLYLQYF